LSGVDKAIHGSSGILIQFPLYFGILALMQTSGLIENISDFFIDISNKKTLPIYTFFSAGLVNMFVPSGGGQWALQGPIILRAALELDMSLSKIILALAYGDQITNMLQPFWALPLLSITGLKAKDILPYTLMLMVMGTVIFLLVLMLF
jgi:short-chain fatty acids transporter